MMQLMMMRVTWHKARGRRQDVRLPRVHNSVQSCVVPTSHHHHQYCSVVIIVYIIIIIIILTIIITMDSWIDLMCEGCRIVVKSSQLLWQIEPVFPNPNPNNYLDNSPITILIIIIVQILQCQSWSKPICALLPTDPLRLPAFKVNPVVICHHLRCNWKRFLGT